MTTWIVSLGTGIALLIAVATGTAAPTRYEQKQGPATVSFQVDGNDSAKQVVVRQAHTLEVEVSVEGDARLKVEPIDKITNSPGWQVLPASPVNIVNLDGDRIRWSRVFEIVPIPMASNTADNPGKLELQLAPLRYRDGASAQEKQAAWEAIHVLVITDVQKADLSELRPITPPEDLPLPPSWRRWLPWIVLGAALMGLAVGAWAVYRRLAGSVPPIPPQVWAVRELEQIERQDLLAAGKVEHYHTLLADLVRAYLEKRFQLPASHQTTVEFLETLRSAAAVPIPARSAARFPAALRPGQVCPCRSLADRVSSRGGHGTSGDS